MTIKSFRTQWSHLDRDIIVFIKDSEIIGSCLLDMQGTHSHFWNLWVDLRYRSQGIGKSLLTQAITNAERYGCDSMSLGWKPVDSNGQVFDWCRKEGFEVDESQPLQGEIILTKHLGIEI